jgi:hypothetical protein
MLLREGFRILFHNSIVHCERPVGIASRNGNPPSPLKKGEPDMFLEFVICAPYPILLR